MKIETKFQPEDKIWTIKDNKAVEASIHSTDISITPTDHSVRHWCKELPDESGFFANDGNCYSTREELINSL